MEVVINTCFGGFSLSPAGIRRLATLQGRKCYFFKHDWKAKKYVRIPDPDGGLFVCAYDIPNPTEKDYDEHHIDDCRDERTNPFLIQVVRELKTKANGSCASLKIVKIPDGTEYTIEEYDGREHIAESHRTWR